LNKPGIRLHVSKHCETPDICTYQQRTQLKCFKNITKQQCDLDVEFN
jgi:hypothetical protein